MGEFETSDSEAGVVACGSGTGGRSGGETPSDDGGSCCCRGSCCCFGGGGDERGVAAAEAEAEADGDERLAKEGVREGLPLLMLLPPPTIDATSSPARKPAS